MGMWPLLTLFKSHAVGHTQTVQNTSLFKSKSQPASYPMEVKRPGREAVTITKFAYP